MEEGGWTTKRGKREEDEEEEKKPATDDEEVLFPDLMTGPEGKQEVDQEGEWEWDHTWLLSQQRIREIVAEQQRQLSDMYPDERPDEEPELEAEDPVTVIPPEYQEDAEGNRIQTPGSYFGVFPEDPWVVPPRAIYEGENLFYAGIDARGVYRVVEGGELQDRGLTPPGSDEEAWEQQGEHVQQQANDIVRTLVDQYEGVDEDYSETEEHRRSDNWLTVRGLQDRSISGSEEEEEEDDSDEEEEESDEEADE